MSDQWPQHRQHLDASANRDVVFCHGCSNEWYRDEQGLRCPRCESEITEVIDLQEDPRDFSMPIPRYSPQPPPAPTSPQMHNDSDPEEADIEEHISPHGFIFRQTTVDTSESDHVHHHHHHHHHEPHRVQTHAFRRADSGVDPVLQRFANMIQEFAGPAPEGQGSSGARTHNIQRTTFRSAGPGQVTASVTIFSGPAPQNGDDPFQAFFNSTLHDMNAPPVPNVDEGANVQDATPAFARNLEDILNLFNPANARAGDAVYTQQALDRIISDLMEQNPQSNAAPPATERGLKDLDRREVTKDLLQGEDTVECTICLDTLQEGQTAAFLPCKHWFHDECAVLWLKQHNTCPVCRTPIETAQQANARAFGQGGNDDNNNDTGPADNNEGGRGNQSGDFPDPDVPDIANFAQNNPTPSRPTNRLSRDPSQGQSFLNQAMHNISYMQREQQRMRARQTPEQQGYDTSRLQRRTSLSPTAPRTYSSAENGSRVRIRSPSASERRRAEDERQSPQSGGGAFSWLRDRFSGSGSDQRRNGRGS